MRRATDGRGAGSIDFGRMYPARRRARLRAGARDERAAARRGAAASTRPSSRSTCWPRTTARSFLSPRSPTTPTANLDACGEMLAHPRHRARPRRRRRPRRHHLRRQLPDLRALALGPRPRPRPPAGGQVVAQQTSAHRRAPSGCTTAASWPRACGPTSTSSTSTTCAARRPRWPTTCPPAASGCCRAPAATAPPSSRGRSPIATGSPPARAWPGAGSIRPAGGRAGAHDWARGREEPT